MWNLLLATILSLTSAWGVQKEYDFGVMQNETTVVCTLNVGANLYLGVSLFAHASSATNVSIILEAWQSWAERSGPYEFTSEQISVPFGNHYIGNIEIPIEPRTSYIVKLTADKDLNGTILLKSWR